MCCESLFHFILTNFARSSHLHDVAMSVKLTNDSSSLSKCSAARAGYYQDDFIRYFVGKHARRSPLIHRQVYYVPESVIGFTSYSQFLRNPRAATTWSAVSLFSPIIKQ